MEKRLEKKGQIFTGMCYWRDSLRKVSMQNNWLTRTSSEKDERGYMLNMNEQINFEKNKNNGRKTDTASLKTFSWHLTPPLKESLKK